MTRRLLNLCRADTKRNGGGRGEGGEIDLARKLKWKDGGEGKKIVLVAGGKSRVCQGENLHLAEMSAQPSWGVQVEATVEPSTPARVLLKTVSLSSHSKPSSGVTGVRGELCSKARLQQSSVDQRHSV